MHLHQNINMHDLGGVAMSLLSYCLCSLLNTRNPGSVSYKRVQENLDNSDTKEMYNLESDSEAESGEENQFLIVNKI